MEREFIHWLRRRLPPHPLLRLGPGDDAAVLNLAASKECVITVDMLTDGVDFKLDEIDPRRAGRKALAANLSDLAAMAARPLAGVVALCLPRKNGRQLAEELYEGMLPLAERYDLAIAGGDTNSWDGPLVISITLLGAVGRAGRCAAAALGPAIGSSSPAPSAAASSAGTSTSSPASTSRWSCTPSTSCTPASTPATDYRSTCRTSARRAAAGRRSTFQRCPWPTTPGDWPSGLPTARRRWSTPSRTARISS